MENSVIEFIEDGSVTSPAGFVAGATHAGVKKDGKSLDLCILYSETPCVAAGIFTQTSIVSAPVRLCRERLKEGKISAIVANSGNANAYTGERGMTDARKMGELAALGIGVEAKAVLVASTGVTGQPLPIDKIEGGMRQVVLSRDGGHSLARAIMTTDTVPKEAAVFVKAGGTEFTIGGAAKGSGMIHPNMGTMFCFLTTDAAVEEAFLKTALKEAADVSFNMTTIDQDTSPSDTMVVMANGKSGGGTIGAGSPAAGAFQEALNQICINLAKALVRDGEGASRLIEVSVSGAASLEDARKAAKRVVASSLVKTAVYGGDPNWGRIVAALSNSGAEIDENKIDMSIGDTEMLRGGKPLPFLEKDVINAFKRETVPIFVSLNIGEGSATAWGCDMSEDYVRINSEYMT